MKANLRTCDRCKKLQEDYTSLYTFTGLRSVFRIKSQEGLSVQSGETDICRECLVEWLNRIDEMAKNTFEKETIIH